MGLRYALGVRQNLTVFPGAARLVAAAPSPHGGRPRKRPRLAPDQHPLTIGALAATVSQSRWKRVTWRNGDHAPLQAEFLAVRVTPVVAWRRGHPLETLWLLCERPPGGTTVRKYHLSNLPGDASLTAIVRLAHTRWAIEQHYQDFKTELGLDLFEGRSYPGWHHHIW